MLGRRCVYNYFWHAFLQKLYKKLYKNKSPLLVGRLNQWFVTNVIIPCSSFVAFHCWYDRLTFYSGSRESYFYQELNVDISCMMPNRDCTEIGTWPVTFCWKCGSFIMDTCGFIHNTGGFFWCNFVSDLNQAMRRLMWTKTSMMQVSHVSQIVNKMVQGEPSESAHIWRILLWKNLDCWNFKVLHFIAQATEICIKSVWPSAMTRKS